MADILVIDDEENLGISMQLALRRAGHTCRLAANGAGGLAAVREKLPDLIFVDVNLPDADGLDLLGKFKAMGADVPVIVITGFGTIASAVTAMQQGAVDYIQKPLSMDEVVLAVERCLENHRMRNQLDAYREAQQRSSDRVQVIANCPAMRDLITVADKIAMLPADQAGELPTVLLLGDTGTGKEALARYMHHRSPNADRPFVQVNCTAVPESLFESELFGHEAGAFTHAQGAKKGLFEMAEEGTLFLDEIGDMPLSTQAKLLVAIESGSFRRLGGTTERVARLRVMAATNRDLEDKVSRGDFRADLFYRLKVFCLELPPLCRRGDDVLTLADHFLRQYAAKFRKPSLRLADDARAALAAYDWPGNVRELSNVLQRTILLAEGDVITAGALNLQPQVRASNADAAMRFDFDREDCTLARVEQRLIDAALARAGGNVSEAARLLGISRGSLRNRIDKRDVGPPPEE
jgi:two-component system response regulator AtoC